MATSRRVPAVENVSTYGAGQTYTVLATWEAATDNDLVTAVAGEGLACLAAQYDDTILPGGATTNISYFRRIYPQGGNFHGGIPDTGVRFFSTADSNPMNAVENFFGLQDVAARVTNNSATGRFALVAGGTAGSLGHVVGCLADNSTNAGSGVNVGLRGAAGGSFVINCATFDNESDGLNCAATGTHTISNCTSASNGGTGFTGISTTIFLNCLGHGNTGADFSGSYSASSGYNASEDATADDVTGIGGERVNQTFTFVDAANDDYHLGSADAGAKDFGTDLSGSASFAFDDDIDLATRSGSWDIGFDEVTAAAGRTTKNTRAFPLGMEIGMGWVMPTQV